MLTTKGKSDRTGYTLAHNHVLKQSDGLALFSLPDNLLLEGRTTSVVDCTVLLA